MFRKTNPVPYGAWRALLLRNGQISLQNPCALALPTQIWFTPEVIILDALDVLYDLFWFWQIFRRAVSVFALRALVISGLMFLISFSYQSPDRAVADISTPALKVGKINALQITSQVVAYEVPDFAWPVSQTSVSNHFSSSHKGIDMPNQYGSFVKPVAAGKVISAGWATGGLGNTVVIQHVSGYLSRYCHLSRIDVQTGEEVGQSDILGGVGTTGITTGSHLHLEVYKDGKSINPLTILP